MRAPRLIAKRLGNFLGALKVSPGSATLMRMGGENTVRPTAINGRYRALLDVASAIAEQPTVKAVLHSLRGVLYSTSRLHGTELYVLDDDEKSLHVFAFDRDADAPAIKTGTKVLCIGAAGRVLEEQTPVFHPGLITGNVETP
jgi:hypothetical protein